MKTLHFRLISLSIIISILLMGMAFSVQSQNTINVSTHASSFTGYSRGYCFTAPCDFVITGLRAPNDYISGAQTIQLVKFSNAIPTWPSVSNYFTTLFYASNITDTCFADVYIPVKTGDIIGVITVRNNGSGTSVTSYPGVTTPLNSNIGLYSVTLHRFGTQQNIINNAGSDFWTETGNSVGRAEIRYEIPDFKIPVPPHATNFTGNSRGMWFTAPTNFVISGVRAPYDANTNAQTIHLVKFPSAPTTHPTLTTTFTTLYYGTQADTNYINMNIPVNTGDIIGVLAVRNNGTGSGVTSYTAANSPITSSIGTHNITLARLGWQGNIISGPAANFWTEGGLPIGRVDMLIEKPAFYKYFASGGIANSFPFFEPPSGSNKRQWIYHPSDFNCSPPGYISAIYLKTAASITSNITGLLIKMGETAYNTFPNSSFVTGLETVLNVSSISLQSSEDNWIKIQLQEPFYYSGNSNFILEISHLGTSPGFYIMQKEVTGRSIYGNSNSLSGTIQDRLAFFGFELINTMDVALLDFSGLSNTLCEGISPVSVLLKNNSPYKLYNAAIDWKVNNMVQPPFNWTGTLNPGNNVNTQIGTYNFIGGNNYNVEAYVSKPNNLFDLVNNNDTIRKLNIYVSSFPVVDLGSDIFIAMGGNVTLDASPGFSSYLWSTGENTQTILVDSTGVGVGVKTIWVEVENSYTCKDRDTINVVFLDNTGLNDVGENAKVMILPNPSAGPFELHFSSFPQGEVIVELFSLEGKKVLQQYAMLSTGNETILVNPEEISDGFYIIRINGNFRTISKKLLFKTK